MIVMLNTSHDLAECSRELGAPVEQLHTPLNGFRVYDETARFAIDNGAYARFDADRFAALLGKHESRADLCRFVAAPDVVGDARRTIEVFHLWESRLVGWPVALVAQNGQEDLPIPWNSIKAVFIGGDTAWKMSSHATAIIRAANALGKWVHVGRVNTPGRFEYFEKAGADSIDGTGLGLYSHMRQRIFEKVNRPTLGLEEARDGKG